MALAGPAASHDVDDLEVGRGLDNREQHDDHGHRHQQRPGNIPEPLPRLGTVDGGGLTKVRADGLQARHQQMAKNGTPRQMLTMMIESMARSPIAEPVDARPLMTTPRLVSIQFRTVKVGSNIQLPGKGRQHGRNNEGQQDEGAGESLAAEIAVQQEGEPETPGEFEHGGDGGVEERVVDGVRKIEIIPDLVVSSRSRRNRPARRRSNW